jgi:predicted small metal-binding protein
MSKMIDCGKVNLASGCGHVVRGEAEEEVFRNARIHAREHGLNQETPELVAMI